MADQTARLEAATVRAEIGSSILYRFSNDGVDEDPIPTASGDITNLKKIILDIQTDGAEKISFATQIYATTAAGIAATTNGAIFLVRSSDPDEIYAVYSNNAGTAVDTGKRALSATAIITATDAAQAAADSAQMAATTATARVAGLHSPAASDPTTRDDGSALQIGDTYFNTTLQAGKTFSSTGWILSSVTGGQLTAAINTREPTLPTGSAGQYLDGTKTFQPLNKSAVGLSNVDNTSDASKPVSTATASALNGKEPTITVGTTGQYWRGDKTFQTLNKAAVGLSNVDNTSDANKPVSTAVQAALDLVNSNLAGPNGTTLVGDKLNATNSVARSVASKLGQIISPMDFGAVGDGVADDTVALTRTFAHLRAQLALVTNINPHFICIDLGNRTYVTTISQNLTKLDGMFAIENGTIIGKCTGKPVLDMIGTRAGKLTNVAVLGDQTNMPSFGIQAARSAETGYDSCDGMFFDQVYVRGWFSVACVYFYGQEETTYLHCKFWQYNPDGWAAILAGSNYQAMPSDYTTAITGATSYINDKYINCDIRYLPVGNIVSITGISKAASAVITAPGHPFVTGNTVALGYINGMTQMNNITASITATTATTFTVNINSTAFSTYTSGGTAIKAQTKPSMYLGRAEQHDFDSCYIVNYGMDHIHVDIPDGNPLSTIKFDILFEGTGSRSNVRFLVAGIIKNFRMNSYNINAATSIFSRATTGVLSFYNSEINIANISVGDAPLLDDVAKYAMYGMTLKVPGSSQFSAAAMLDRFTGTISIISNGLSRAINQGVQTWKDSTSFVPVATAGSGTITSYTATFKIKYIGSTAFITATVNITNKGTAVNSVIITLPFVAAGSWVIPGREIGVSGAEINGVISDGGSTMTIAAGGGGFPLGANTSGVLLLSGPVDTTQVF